MKMLAAKKLGRQRFERFKKFGISAAITGILALGSMLGAEGSASASINWPSQWSHTWTEGGGWVNVRTCSVISNCGVKFSLYGYNPVKMLCWTNGTYAYGTAKWFYVYSDAAKNYGYVNAGLIPDQVWSPPC